TPLNNGENITLSPGFLRNIFYSFRRLQANRLTAVHHKREPARDRQNMSEFHRTADSRGMSSSAIQISIYHLYRDGIHRHSATHSSSPDHCEKLRHARLPSHTPYPDLFH